MRKLPLAFAIGTVSLLTGAVSVAADDNTAASSAAAQPRGTYLEEVVVTARRREESLQGVPVSITAFSADAMDKASIQEMENLTAVVPGFRFSFEGGANNVSMSLRGLGIIPIGEGVPSVVVYSNDVPLPKVGGNVPTYDLESIQVLKGPQGTLFGRNTIGGAVLITPRAPDYEQDGYLRVGAGNYDSSLVEGAGNITLVENVAALRIAGQMRKRGPTEKNLDSGPDLNDVDQKSLRISLLLEPTENLTNTLVFDYFKADQRPGTDHVVGFNPGVVQAAFAPSLGQDIAAAYEQAVAQAAAGIRAAGAHRVSNNFHNDGNNRGHTFNSELWGIANTTEYSAGDITLRNIFGYRRVSSTIAANTQGFGAIDGPLGPLVIYHLASQDEKEYFSNEFQILGSSERLEWIVGGFYSRDEPTAGMGTSAQSFNLLDFGASDVHTTALTENENYAVFGQIGYSLTDALTLNLGARYSWDKIEGCGIGGLGYYLSPGQCADSGASIVKSDGGAPTWTVGLDYQATDSLFLYATHRRGYRGVNINTPRFYSPATTGGTDPGCIAGAGQCADLRPFQTVDEEQIDDFELGMKLDWTVGGTVGRTNLSLFHTRYTDAVQFVSVRGVVPTSAPDNPTRSSVAVNAADLTINGVELELVVSPTDSLTLSLTASHMDQTVDKVNVPVIGGQALTKDNVTLPTPEFSGTAAVRYVLPFTPLGGELSMSADYYHTGKWDAQSGVSLPGYELVNARLDLAELAAGKLALALWARNLLDEEYATAPGSLQATLPARTAFFGDPRTFGVEATYRF